MKEINIEELYHSYINNGVINNWKLDFVLKEKGMYACSFTHLATGEKDVKTVKKSLDRRINSMIDAIFCD